MSILTPKSTSRENFYKVTELKDGIAWLENQYKYEPGLITLLNEAENEDDIKLIRSLLERVEHFTSENILDNLETSLYTILKDLEPTKTFIIATSNGRDSDGGAAWLYDMKYILAGMDGWSENNLKASLHENYDEITKYNIENIVIFDDFIGTGKTIKDKTNDFKIKLKEIKKDNLNISILALAGMDFGVTDAISSLGIEITCPILLKKGISDYTDDESAKSHKSLMLKLESKLKKKNSGMKLSNFSLGYAKSEALFNIYRKNCPNNVFPIFWWSRSNGGNFRVSLFRRL
ncbi:hypothetical protein B7489_23210 [Vibrio alginolyticus]|uniref:phosphoribosyltransferase-like protein n=1 Tax=Vibrio alginolyticus TaxID=663 RepID=UPI000A1F789C|nr:hypothetical protein [Vibrio alginolyticus]OSP09039.1 hypothetical protein B7489_23210 [Vibrio alginolyticus]